MSISRRTFIAGAAVATTARALPALESTAPPAAGGSFDPWLEIDAAAIAHNARTVSRLVGGRPILAVAKNNAYGCGLSTAGPILDRLEPVWALAVVRADEARTLRRAGVRKPVLLMGPASDEEIRELAPQNVRIAAYKREDAAQLMRVAKALAKPVGIHLYVDTGMRRMGLPYTEALAWLETPGLARAIRIEGAFTELTEDPDFDREQASRLRTLADTAKSKGVSLGRLHAASSDAIARPTSETFLDMVRPGLAMYGGYATADAMARAELKPAFRLRARVIRVDSLAPGDGVSYHRRYVADQAMATATLAIGHVDGYPTGATKGCQVLIRGGLHPVIGTVSASHTMVALDAGHGVQVGDAATLVGPDDPALHPNVVAQRSAWSEYNMFMHLHAQLARRVV